MKRLSNNLLASCLLGEVAAMICSIVLTEKNDYVWAVVCFISIIILITFYECVSRISYIISTWNEERNNSEIAREEKIRDFCTQMMDKMDQKTTLISEKVEDLKNLNEKLIANNDMFCEKIDESLTKILTSSNTNIESMISKVETNLLRNSDLANKVLDENIAATRSTISGIVDNTKELMLKQYERLEKLNDSLNLNTKKYTQQLMEQILSVSSNNISEMKSSYENLLNTTAERIVSENDEVVVKRKEEFEKYISNLEKTYDSLISSHISILEKHIVDSIVDSIDLFISENKDALKSNSKLAAELISCEKTFVSEIESNNVKLREIINNAFVEYSKSVEKNIDELKTIYFNHVDDIDEHAKTRIQNMIEQFKTLNVENAELFSDSMVQYREKFVKANAIAIAEVQGDNVKSIIDANEKISQLATNFKKFQEDIVKTIELLDDTIKDGINDYKEKKEDFDSEIKNLVDEKLSEYDYKVQKYNEGIDILEGKISEVIDAWQSNTSKYEETLQSIVEAQKEANSLNEKDVDLLKAFMKR